MRANVATSPLLSLLSFQPLTCHADQRFYTCGMFIAANKPGDCITLIDEDVDDVPADEAGSNNENFLT